MIWTEPKSPKYTAGFEMILDAPHVWSCKRKKKSQSTDWKQALGAVCGHENKLELLLWSLRVWRESRRRLELFTCREEQQKSFSRKQICILAPKRAGENTKGVNCEGCLIDHGNRELKQRVPRRKSDDSKSQRNRVVKLVPNNYWFWFIHSAFCVTDELLQSMNSAFAFLKINIIHLRAASAWRVYKASNQSYYLNGLFLLGIAERE